MKFGKKKAAAKAQAQNQAHQALANEVRHFYEETARVMSLQDKDAFLREIPAINVMLQKYLAFVEPMPWVALHAATADAYRKFGELEMAALKYETVCDYAAMHFGNTRETFGDFYILSEIYAQQGAYGKAAAALEKGLDLYERGGQAQPGEIASYRNKAAALKARG